ncbi:MAG TPA: methylaspartate mutase [Firmicutes bacterium]|nr:methylaspartate mutase [Candidatus Fermentithermobacillaceae bacterium]
MKRILAADVGNILTKVALFHKEAGRWKLAGRAFFPTTVEPPESDVMAGLREAVSKLETSTKFKLLEGARLITPAGDTEGADMFVATSSAGGGLRLLVAGLSPEITAESAHRAALGAGAVVAGILSVDDIRQGIDAIERIRRIEPDTILLTGGTDGGNVWDVAALAELVAMADPRPRFNPCGRMPVIYAGNVDAKPYVTRLLEGSMDVVCVDNIRPVLEEENLEPVRAEILKVFFDRVVAHLPGYRTLSSWAEGPVKPTPAATGEVLTHLAAKKHEDVLGVDVGGSTVDVFSIIGGKLYRTVSLGARLSHQTGAGSFRPRPEEIAKWLPQDVDEDLVRNWYYNRVLHPTTVPETFEDLMLEQGFVREALKVSLEQHISLTRGLKGIHQRRQIGDLFHQSSTGESLVNPMKIRTIVASGIPLSCAPRLSQAVLMLLDGLMPQGITDLVVDEKCVLPHLGALFDVCRDVAEELIEEALVSAGTCISPVGPKVPPGRVIARVKVLDKTCDIVSGELLTVPIEREGPVTIEVIVRREFDVGGGKGNHVVTTVHPGALGLILDGRGRPLAIPERPADRKAALRKWFRSVKAFPDLILSDAVRAKIAD